VAGEHEAGGAPFIEDGNAIPVSVGESFVSEGFNVIEPDALAANFVPYRAGSVDESAEKSERLFAHRSFMEDAGKYAGLISERASARLVVFEGYPDLSLRFFQNTEELLHGR
jgi:hypothetical protein